jgi:hypothetical protein
MHDHCRFPDLHDSDGKAARIDELAKALELRLAELDLQPGSHSISIEGLRLNLTVLLIDDPEEVDVWWESSTWGEKIREDEVGFAESIVQRISAKMAKTLSIQPCHLVLYPNPGGVLNLGAVLRRVRKQLPADCESRFASCWLAGDSWCHRLWPA